MSTPQIRIPDTCRSRRSARVLSLGVSVVLAIVVMAESAVAAPHSSTIDKCGWLIEKAAAERSTAAGKTITYHVWVTRTGGLVRGGRLQDFRGEGTASYGTVHQGTVAAGGGRAATTTFDLGPLGTGDRVEIIYDVNVASSLSRPGQCITNYVQLDLQGCHVSLDHVICTGPPNDTKGASPAAQTVSEPINAATGEYFTIPTCDLFLGGPLGVGFSRYYASGLAEEGVATSALGANWRHNYEMELAASRMILRTFVSPSGRVVPFVTLFLGDEQGWSRNARQEPVPYELKQDGGGNFWLLDPLRQTVMRFDEAGQLQELQDRNHNRLTFHRDRQSGRLEEVTDGLGRTLAYAYTGDRLSQVTDGSRQVTLAYDATGALASATNVLGGVTAYTYDMRRGEGPLMTARTLPRGNVPFRQAYDVAGRAVRQADAGDNATVIEHATPAEGQTRVTDPTGGVRTFTHVDGRLCTAIEDPPGNTTTLRYDDRALGRNHRPPGRYDLGDVLRAVRTSRHLHRRARSHHPLFVCGAGADLCKRRAGTRHRCLRPAQPGRHHLSRRYERVLHLRRAGQRARLSRSRRWRVDAHLQRSRAAPDGHDAHRWDHPLFLPRRCDRRQPHRRRYGRHHLRL